MQYREMTAEIENDMERWLTGEQATAGGDETFLGAWRTILQLSLVHNSADALMQYRILGPDSNSVSILRLHTRIIYLRSMFPRKLFNQFRENVINGYVSVNTLMTKRDVKRLIEARPVFLFMPVLQKVLYQRSQGS